MSQEHEYADSKGYTYSIIRFYQDGRECRIIKTMQTLKQAQEHCRDPAAHGDGWFDGYEKEL